MPKPFNKLTAIAAPIMRGNIDTDVIIRIERLVGNSVRGTLGQMGLWLTPLSARWFGKS